MKINKFKDIYLYAKNTLCEIYGQRDEYDLFRLS